MAASVDPCSDFCLGIYVRVDRLFWCQVEPPGTPSVPGTIDVEATPTDTPHPGFDGARAGPTTAKSNVSWISSLIDNEELALLLAFQRTK